MAKKDKRKKILSALEKMIQGRRFHEVTLDEVAQYAGVGKGTIYRYFADKEDLFHQLMTYGFDEMCEGLLEIDASKLSFEEHLVAMCTKISEFFMGRHALARMMGETEARMHGFHAKHKEVFIAKRSRLHGIFVDVFRNGIEQGLIRTDLPVEAIAALLMGLMRTRNLWYMDTPAQRPSIKEMVNLYLNGAGVVN
jgi:AcrR family transcriptional regulator